MIDINGKLASFNVKFEKELNDLKKFRDALRTLEKQAVYDEIIKACIAEQNALENENIPSVLDAIILTASVINRTLINKIARQLDLLEETIRKLEPKDSSVENEDAKKDNALHSRKSERIMKVTGVQQLLTIDEWI